MPAVRPIREDHLGASTFIEKGWHQIASGDFVAAEKTIRTALQLAPSEKPARTLLGWAIMRQARYDEAYEIFTDVLREDEGNALARANLGYVCMRKALLSEAHEHMDSAARLGQDAKASLYAFFYLGLLYGELGDTPEAERYFNRTLALAPNFIEAYYEMGRTFWRAGETADAERVWKAGNAANRFSAWGRRCVEAIRLTREGKEPGSFS